MSKGMLHKSVSLCPRKEPVARQHVDGKMRSFTGDKNIIGNGCLGGEVGGKTIKIRIGKGILRIFVEI